MLILEGSLAARSHAKRVAAERLHDLIVSCNSFAKPAARSGYLPLRPDFGWPIRTAASCHFTVQR